MPKGGARAGAGRPKGAANKFSEAARAKAAAVGITPLEYMLAVLRNDANDQHDRMDAAKAAAPYMHARLESVKHSGAIGGYDLTKATDDDLDRIADLLEPLTDTTTDQDGEGEA